MLNYFKNIFIIFCIITLSFFSFSYADEIDNIEDKINVENTLKEVSSSTSNIPSLNSRAAVVIDRNSNTVLYGKNENEIKKMASTTKIMTSIIVIENSNLSDIVTVSKKAAGTGGSRLGLKTNDKISVNNLLYGLMLCSGNDAAVCLAEYVGGNIEGFAELMNQKANSLGLKNTHFVTPHGLDAEDHYTTAYELAILTNYALKNETSKSALSLLPEKTFSKIVNTKSTSIFINNESKSISNTNELLGVLPGVYGVKTGFTNGANRCLVTSCKRDNLDIICVVLGADTKKFRTQDSIKLIEYVFSTFDTVDVQKIANDNFENWKNSNKILINKGIKNTLEPKLTDLPFDKIAIKKEDMENIAVKIDIEYMQNAPITENSVVGTLSIMNGNNMIVNSKIVCNTDVPKKSILDYILYISHNYFNLILQKK